jgi:EAL domain-containing protein (putative c-di-GMP-specific phosphodiesterase class I)
VEDFALVAGAGRGAEFRQQAVQAPPAGVLYLSPPLSEAQRTIRTALRGVGAGYEELRLGTLVVKVDPGGLAAIGSALAVVLSDAELSETQSLFLADGLEPDLPDLLRSQPLSRLVSRLRGERIEALLRDGRLVVHFQPIVYTDAPQTVFGYECLTRGVDADGAIVPAGRLFADAAASGLLVSLDERARQEALRAASIQAPPGRLFVNCTPTALCDPRHDHAALLATLAEVGRSTNELVLEVVESEAVAEPARLARVLDAYREVGINVALDDLGAGHSSLSLLAEIRPDFVKLDKELVRDVDRSPLKATFARKLLEAAGEEGIGVIAEGVETIAEWRWLRLYGADFVQGYLFAAPGVPPPLPRHPVERRESTLSPAS